MTSRELRSRRRAEERKARKQERKQLADVRPEEEAQPKDQANPLPEIGFVSQKSATAARRVEINRQNAENSTGPGSPEGKLASSRNSTKHGLAGRQIIIPGEDAAAFDALLSVLLAEHQPASTTEQLLVNEMAQSHWLTQRAIRLQNECFDANVQIDIKRLALFLRYQTTHQRAFHKALSTLLTVQKGRRKAEIGFVSQGRPSTASKTGFVSQRWLPEPDNARFVWQNPSETRLQEEVMTPQTA
ncbi:MAG TPA: hypothetical protein VGL97_10550 [Bryobacteraceae bacterium]